MSQPWKNLVIKVAKNQLDTFEPISYYNLVLHVNKTVLVAVSFQSGLLGQDLS